MPIMLFGHTTRIIGIITIIVIEAGVITTGITGSDGGGDGGSLRERFVVVRPASRPDGRDFLQIDRQHDLPRVGA